jgi:hypothetical protein
MKSLVEKFFVPNRHNQEHLKRLLMEALFDTAGLEENLPNITFKVQARNNEGSFATLTVYNTGTVLVVGHGPIFDLTHSVCKLYHNHIPQKDFTAPTRKDKDGRKRTLDKRSQLKTEKKR